jgi:diaminohydroxyphosphoribosylaminopyrimidine deaminase/5-amino-6-(5-phosphoribosylamino)uracil reductase
MPRVFATDDNVMRHALSLAARGLGGVEPNPPVGAVVVDGERRLLGEGWHQRYGGPHAEPLALAQAGEAARGATLFVTLEPCCHFGKTPPCSQAVLAAGISRVVVAVADPNPRVAGGGIRELQAAGVTVEVGLLAADARRLLAPFFRLVTTGRPWVHAKWAMTCDGKLASRTGHSQWISGEASRAVVHQLRGRMDAIVVGIGTVFADDPLLTARPPGPRVATRLVLDRHARLPLDSQLVKSAREAPMCCVVAEDAPSERSLALQMQGVEVLRLPNAADPRALWNSLLDELGRRRMTHVLIEGGGQVLGSAFDAGVIDECHVFVAPKLLGGIGAPSPIGGLGREVVSPHADLVDATWRVLGEDAYLHGWVRHSS